MMNDQLIAAFRTTPTRRQLYDIVARSRTIQLEPGTAGQWTVDTTAGTTRITHTP
jgi:hypothetical protein